MLTIPNILSLWTPFPSYTQRRSFLLLLKENLIFAMVKKKECLKLNSTFAQADSLGSSQDKLYRLEVTKTSLKFCSRKLLNNAIVLFQDKPGLL